MTSLFAANLAEFSSSQLLGLLISAMGIGALVIISLVGVWAGAWTTASKLRLEHDLKQQMLDRGLSPDEMIRVLASTRPRERGDELPCASEVVVDIDDEWHTGLILKRDEDRYFVHVVGTEMSENQWVSGDRVRFPALADGEGVHASDWSLPAGFSRTGGRNGVEAKPAGVDREL
jgi:hypothetical protein